MELCGSRFHSRFPDYLVDIHLTLLDFQATFAFHLKRNWKYGWTTAIEEHSFHLWCFFSLERFFLSNCQSHYRAEPTSTLTCSCSLCSFRSERGTGSWQTSHRAMFRRQWISWVVKFAPGMSCLLEKSRSEWWEKLSVEIILTGTQILGDTSLMD